jgi:hypothetical protein
MQCENILKYQNEAINRKDRQYHEQQKNDK